MSEKERVHDVAQNDLRACNVFGVFDMFACVHVC